MFLYEISKQSVLVTCGISCVPVSKLWLHHEEDLLLGSPAIPTVDGAYSQNSTVHHKCVKSSWSQSHPFVTNLPEQSWCPSWSEDVAQVLKWRCPICNTWVQSLLKLSMNRILLFFAYDSVILKLSWGEEDIILIEKLLKICSGSSSYLLYEKLVLHHSKPISIQLNSN